MKEIPAQLRSSGIWRKVSGFVKVKLSRGKALARLRFFWAVFSVIRMAVWIFKYIRIVLGFIEDHFG